MVLFALANAGLPGTSGFVGEFLVILAALRPISGTPSWRPTIDPGSGLHALARQARDLGRVANDGVASLKDLNGREFVVLATLAVAVLLLGLWPAPLLDVMRPTIGFLVEQLMVSKL